jgi:hypothetical protein
MARILGTGPVPGSGPGTLQQSPEQLASRREEELHESELLDRVQLTFDEAF